MAYDVFIRSLNTDKSENKNTGGWFSGTSYRLHDLYPNKFKEVLFAGDYDYYGKFSKVELLGIGQKFSTRWKLPNTLSKYEEQVASGELSEHWMSKRHYELLEMLRPFDDAAIFHVDAIFWESGMN